VDGQALHSGKLQGGQLQIASSKRLCLIPLMSFAVGLFCRLDHPAIAYCAAA